MFFYNICAFFTGCVNIARISAVCQGTRAQIIEVSSLLLNELHARDNGRKSLLILTDGLTGYRFRIPPYPLEMLLIGFGEIIIPLGEPMRYLF